MAQIASERFGQHDAVGREEELAGERDARRLARVGWDVRIEQAEALNHLAAEVAEQCVANVVGVREGSQDLDGVRGDDRDADAVGFDLFEREVQLDQLIAAVRSPVG